MQPSKDLSHPSTVCYVFEKVAIGDHIDKNALLAKVKNKKTFVIPNRTRTRLLILTCLGILRYPCSTMRS